MTRTLPTLAAALLVGALVLGAGGAAVRQALADAPAAATPAAADVRAPLPPPPRFVAKLDDEKKTDPKDRVETVEGVIKAVPAGKAELVVTVDEDDRKADRTVPVPAGAKVLFGGKAVVVGDLRPGMHVELGYKGNSTDLVRVKAGWPQREVVFKAADPAAKSFSIETGGDDGGFEVVLRLDPDAKVTVDELPAGLADVPAGRKVRVDLSLDKKGVIGIEADGAPGTLPGLVKKYDAAAATLLVEVRASGFRDDRVLTLAFPLAAGAKVRLAGKDVSAAELKERMPVRLTFAADRRTVTGVLAAAPLPPEVNDDD